LRHRLVNSSPVRGVNDNIIGSVSVVRDITGRKHMEEELRKSRDELELRVKERTSDLNRYMAKLEQSNQALQDFAFIAAHDMKEPLRKVISFGNMLRQKSGESLGQPGNDYLNRMLNATERMQSLLAGLLDYSQVATASEPFKEVDLSHLIGEVLSDLEVRILKSGGKVDVGDLPVILADPTQMRQLFQNLIGNALKFHKPGVKPMVWVRSISNTDSGCQIIVEDNGIGFEEQHIERIFAPFLRLHDRSSQYEGTGMGLAICKKIVERHGGTITAKSSPGQGATFIITLPPKKPD
jgi:light-regulated signal transduction histidine kinase (bacteriophytochrome)